MAGEMNVTTETLRTYVKNVLAKLGAHSVPAEGLVRLYTRPVRHRLAPPG